MAFFLPSSASTSTTTSLSSSPLRRLDSDHSDDDGNESLRHQRSDDIPTTESGFTMFGLLSRRIDYISGASASDISSLEESSESEGESSSWTRRATFGEGEDEDRGTSTRMSRSTREDARSPTRRRPPSPDIYDDDPSVPQEPNHSGRSGSQGALVVHRTGRISTSEPNVVSSANQNESEETGRRRRRRHGSTEEDVRNSRRVVKSRNRRRHSHVFEGYISRDFFLIIILCFGLACAWMVLARPIMMNWLGSRSGDDGYMMYIMDG